MVDLSVRIGNLYLKNPVLTASGTFGYGEEFSDFIDLNKLGGIIVKSITLKPREGNPYPRMAETPSGMLNTVGLQNKGVDYFVSHIYPRISTYNTNIIANVSGSTVEEYVEVCKKLINLDKIPAVELNVSCPNVKEGGMAFGVSCSGLKMVVSAVRKVYNKTLIVKLSPNVTDIVELAKIAEGEGADALSLINTLLGMAVDIKTRRPVLSTITGGLSGPAIKPVSLRMVWQVANAVKVPVIGVGGIMNYADALEFIIAGASAIQVGTANFIDPKATIKIIKGIENYMIENKISSISNLIGCLKT
jgi:dihydroorotate dehydrogenase (NAD+) catalytic subunit